MANRVVLPFQKLGRKTPSLTAAVGSLSASVLYGLERAFSPGSARVLSSHLVLSPSLYILKVQAMEAEKE